MKYTCDFVHPKTRERRTIVVDLNKTEVAALAHRHAVVGEAYALRHAYRRLPRGFLHDSVERVQLH
jgi:formylmethanofuran dehydrogenase subunit B